MPTLCEQYRQAYHKQLARVTKGLAHPTRLQLLDLLLQAPRTVEVLAHQLGLSIASTSQHLQVLRTSRLVESDKHGLYVTYRLADESVYDLMQALRRVAQQRLAELEQLTRAVQAESAHVPRTTLEDLGECLQRGDVLLLDVRPAEEYEAAHVEGALSIPLPELESRLGELPKDRQVIVYCRGEYCLMARQAAELLQQRGFLASHLEEDVRTVAAAGLKTTAGA